MLKLSIIEIVAIICSLTGTALIAVDTYKCKLYGWYIFLFASFFWLYLGISHDLIGLAVNAAIYIIIEIYAIYKLHRSKL